VGGGEVTRARPAPADFPTGPKKTPAGVAGVVGREEEQRERYYFFFLPAFLAFFLAGFFLAMPQCRKYFPRLHEKSARRKNFFRGAKPNASAAENYCAAKFSPGGQRP
jgi:hypothetical protein